MAQTNSPAPRTAGALALTFTAALSFALCACEVERKSANAKPAPATPPASATTPAFAPPVANTTTDPPPAMPANRLEQFAQRIAASSPSADPADMNARKTAAAKLAKLAELIDSDNEYVLWGSFDKTKAYDLNTYHLTALESLVAIKIYLSMFTFSGAHTIQEHGDLSILEMPANFRDRLEPGAYPLPFWHSPQEWLDYAGANSIRFVFKGEMLLAILHEGGRADAPTSVPTWDGKWTWTNAKGDPQPQAAQFSFLLSPENPEAPALQDSYDAICKQFRAHNCLACHTHDPSEPPARLFVLSDPVHSMAVSNLLVPLLENDDLPAKDPHRNRPDGIVDDDARKQLLALAEQFQIDAENALQYEAARRASNAPD